MNSAIFDDDEPIHHQSGKANADPCPGVTNTQTQFALNLPLFPTSPPPRLPASRQDNEGHGKHCRMKSLFNKLFKTSKSTGQSPVVFMVNGNVTIEASTVEIRKIDATIKDETE